MFRALTCSSSGGTVYTTIGIFFVRFVSANKCSKHVEAINRNKLKENVHLFGPIILIYYDVRSTKH
jgi:hypothetical protein